MEVVEVRGVPKIEVIPEETKEETDTETQPASYATPGKARSKSKKLSSADIVRRSSRLKRRVSRFKPSAINRTDKYESMYYESSSSSDSEDNDRQVYGGSEVYVPNEDPNRKIRADVAPIEIDSSVNWESIGGLDTHIQSLKEMIVFPLLYEDIFNRFSVVPPKGVLFYGPPGTGKTLVARALANVCSQYGRKVSFFMRKGADVLSKWVGEAERQLRLLFEQAKRMQPSIIFFDEIDGLAPVRSSRQDQIHSSIVSTLLALMDGLENRGQIVVIGATNRIDQIDPALRRPGRFDREFLFSLPTNEGRRAILDIHTAKWDPPVPEDLKQTIVTKTVGYCGADIKALCTEASLKALRRLFPQIYETNAKLLIDPKSIQVDLSDWLDAMASITPTAQRDTTFVPHPFTPELSLLLGDIPNRIIAYLKKEVGVLEKFRKDENWPTIYRPWVLIHGEEGMGQSAVASHILYNMESLPIQNLDLSTLFSEFYAKSLEESLVLKLKEVFKKIPTIIYLPHINTWWGLASQRLKTILLNFLRDLDPHLPVCLLVESDVPLKLLETEFVMLFEPKKIFEVKAPSAEELRGYWGRLTLLLKKKAEKKMKLLQVPLKEVPIVVEERKENISEEEKVKLKMNDEAVMRRLRETIRRILERVKTKRKFSFFFQRYVNPLKYPRYYNTIKEPMDLFTIERRNDSGYYTNLEAFVMDLKKIRSNMMLYFEIDDPSGLIHKSTSLEDWVLEQTSRIRPNFIEQCNEAAKRVPRGPKIAPLKPPSKQSRNSRKKEKSYKRNRSSEEEESQERQKKVKNVQKETLEAKKEKVKEAKEGLGKNTSPQMGPVVQEQKEMGKVNKGQGEPSLGTMAPLLPKVSSNSSSFTFEEPSVIYDEARWKKILESLVEASAKWNVDTIVNLYSAIAKNIWNKREHIEKNQLLEEIEELIKNFVVFN
uniref:Bromo domain-containing protein n=1 Tax=Arcella intermedia TaxID=1963864 RepID=A0A6B2KXG9_9EUKA